MTKLHDELFDYITKNGGEFPGNNYWSNKFKLAYEQDIEASPVNAVVGLLTNIDDYAFEMKMCAVRKRKEKDEHCWQFYRDALKKVAIELKLDWHPRYI